MAGDGAEGADLKGIKKYFNSQTFHGRANVAKATYAVLGTILLINWLKPKKK